jgi:hypothetical protein
VITWLKTLRYRYGPLAILVDAIERGQLDFVADVVRDQLRSQLEAATRVLGDRLSQARDPDGIRRLIGSIGWLSHWRDAPRKRIVQILAPYLGKEFPESVRSVALREVSTIDHPYIAPLVLGAFGTESEELDTVFMQWAMGRLRLKEALPRLAKNARYQKSSFIRKSACQALGELGDPQAVGFLGEIFETERAEDVRLAAAIGVAKGGVDDHNAYLDGVLRQGPSGLATDVLDFRLSTGDLQVLGPTLERIKQEHPNQAGWFRSLGRFFPQMPRVGEFNGSSEDHVSGWRSRRVIAWIEKYRSAFQWISNDKNFVVPQLPMPRKNP